MLNKSKKIKIFDSDALKNFHKRIFFSIVVFLCCYLIAVFRIADVMLFEVSASSILSDVVKQQRGKIFDRNGQLLSTNINSYSLFANSRNIKNKEKLSKQLSYIIDINSEIIYEKLNSNKKFVYLKRNISPKEHQKIIELGEINLQTHLESKRVYPFKNASSHIVGYVNIDNIGKAGIEAAYDDLLNLGKDINLTIDVDLQQAVRGELMKTIKKFSAESGSALIMDIKTSEIIAMNNYPDFDPNNLSKSSSNGRLNRLLQSNYEMGSTFKPLTVAMGIDSKLIHKDMIFDVSKPIKNITDWDPCSCSLSVRDIIVKSSNIGIAQIAKIIGKNNQIKFFKKVGFYEPVKINLLEAANPFGQPYNWGDIETMTIGFGHAFAITPLHLAVAYNSILNSGRKIDPKLILNEKDNPYTQVIKKETSEYIATLLRAVVQETKYTGPRVRISGYDIGGKTGTAELINNGKYDKNLNRTIFVGAFPMSEPKYLILTIIDKPKRKNINDSITSATVNAPLVKNIILRMIEILNLTKEKNNILNAATTINYKDINVIN